MPQRNLIFRSAIFSFVLVWLANSNVLFGQNPLQETKSVSDTIAKIIDPVALADIGPETDKTLAKIREFKNVIKKSDAEIVLDSLVPLKLEQINRIKNDIDLEEIEQLKLRQTESLKNDFVQINVQLEGWRKTYTNKTEEINKLRDELKELETKWLKTLSLKRDEPLPDQVLERINTNLQELSAFTKDLNDRNNQLLTKITELTDALSFVDDVLSTISKSELSYKEQILTIDSPPFWQMFSYREDSTSFNERFNGLLKRHQADLANFRENYETNIYWHMIFFAVLLFSTILLKRDVAKWSDGKRDEAIGYSLHVIGRPISSALLVALLTAALFYPDAPLGVLNYYYIILVIPILRLLPELMPSIPRKFFYFMAAVFVLSQLTEYFSELIIIDRLLLLLIDVFTLFILLQVIKSKDDITAANTRIRWDFAFSILKIAILLLTISSFANIIGNTFLAKLLSRGSLTMVYAGTIIYGSALVLRSLFSLLLQLNAVQQLNMVQAYPDEVKKNIFKAIRIVSVVYWVYLSLDRYMIYEPIYGWFEGMITKEWQVGSMPISIGSILAFFITLWIALTISKFIRFILQDEILTHFEMPRGVPGAISMIVRLVLITIGFILAFGAAKIDMNNIAIIFGALGVGIGFGLQNIFNNLVSGLILAFERPIQVGDIIQISTLNLMGEVKEIGIRASIVRTFDGAEVVVPNGNLISNEMINWTLSDHRRRQEIIVGVAYGTDTTKVLELLNELVPQQENVLKNPPPLVIFLGFGESSLDFRVLFWTRFDVGLGTKSAVGIAIDEAFKKNGIEIPFPQRDLHVRSVSKDIDLSGVEKPVKKTTPRKSNAPKKADDK